MNTKLAFTLVAMMLLFTMVQVHGQQPQHVIVLRFDDGDADQYLNAVPIMQRYGFTATFCIPTGELSTDTYMTWTQVTSLYKSGYEVASHTVTHPDDMNALSTFQLNYELQQSSSDIQSHNIAKPVSFCYPHSLGYNNDTVRDGIVKSGYLYATSGGDEVYSVISGDKLNIHSVSVDDNGGSTDDPYFQQYAQMADTGHVVVFLFHHVGGNYTDYAISPDSFASKMQWLKANGYNVETLSQAMSSI